MSKRAIKKPSEALQQEDVLQAVVMCDTFNERFTPISHFKPAALFPLVNALLLDYTLEFLALAGVQEAILFCVSHAELIKEHVNCRLGQWGGMAVTVMVSEGCRSVGDAMRDLDAKAAIRGDFVLLSGHTVANLQLLPVLEQHRRRRGADKGAVMTLIYKEAAPGHSIRPRGEEVLLAVDAVTSRILFHQKPSTATKKISFPLEVFVDNPAVDLLYDLSDTDICVCSNAVPPIFSDNFDFQTRVDFVRGLLLNEEILASTLYCHRLRCAEYAASVDSWPMYQAVSHDVIHRWAYPLVPDSPLDPKEEAYMFLRQNVYRQKSAKLAKGCVLQQDVVIGEGSTVGEHSTITRSVIGRNCHIGSHVTIQDSFLWDNVTVQNSCVISQCLLAADCRVTAGVKLSAGCILCPGVHLETKVELSGVKLVASRIDTSQDCGRVQELDCLGGAAYVCVEGAAEDDSEDEGHAEPPPGLWLGAVEAEGDGEDVSVSSGDLSDRESPIHDDTNLFYQEVLDSLARGYEDGLACDNLILEINSSRYAYNVSVKEVNYHVVRALLNLPEGSSNYLPRLAKQLVYFLPILANYIKRNREAQRDCLQAIEEVSELRPELRDCAEKLLHLLYDKDVIEESVILQWFHAPNADLPSSARLRKQVSGFVKWLQEADEESNSEDSD